MGTYVYTFRKAARIVDGLAIGQFKFAYKYGGWPDSRVERARDLLLGTARRSRDAVPASQRLAIMGDWSGEEPLAVYDVDPDVASFYDGPNPGPVAGYVRKVGRAWRFERAPNEILSSEGLQLAHI